MRIRSCPALIAAMIAPTLLGLRAFAVVPEGPVLAETERILARAVGFAEPSVLARVAASMPGEELIAACYRGERSGRLVAISAAAYLEPGREVLPYLIALAGARQRETASRATASLMRVMERMEREPEVDPEMVPGQAGQLIGQCLELARDRRLAPDVRLAGLTSAERLARMTGVGFAPGGEFLGDPETAIRGAAMSLLDVPLDEDGLGRVASMASADEDPVLRGQAAGLLCENALAHRVSEPSADLQRLLGEVIDDEEVPPDGLATILGCLARFPRLARAALVERITSRDVPELVDLWKTLEQGAP